MLNRVLKRKKGFKVYRKKKTYIIPTVSFDPDNEKLSRIMIPRHFNLTKSDYFNPILSERERNKLMDDEQNYSLHKTIVDYKPNTPEFLEYLNLKKKENIIFACITKNPLSWLEELVQKENKLKNLIVTVQDPNLTSDELLDAYDKVNLPMGIGLSSRNVLNFKDTETETASRLFLKEMFPFYNKIKLVELGFRDLVSLIKKKPSSKKTADFDTVIDFLLMSEFKGYLEVSLNGVDCTEEGIANVRKTLKLVDDVLLERGFNFGKVQTKTDLCEIFNQMPPSNDFITLVD